MPRAALHALHARVSGVGPDAWADTSLVQVWGPRFTAYVVPARDVAVFTLGRLPPPGARRRLAEDLADRLERLLGGGSMTYGAAGSALGVDPNQLRYAAPTGRVLIRWEGARAPEVRCVPAPEADPDDAARELVRRYLHVLGPGSADGFARWAGVRAARAAQTFAALRDELTPARTRVGEGWFLTADEAAVREPVPPAPARLLPSGDPYLLLHGADRELVVADVARREEVWTPRVWPGALVLRGEVAGTWRRTGASVLVRAWGRLAARAREEVAAEAAALPVPGAGRVGVRWEE